MAEKPVTDKTEQPTPRKISKARDEGQVPQSQEISSAAAIIVLVAAVAITAPSFMQWALSEFTQAFSCNKSVFIDKGAFIKHINSKCISALIVAGPIFAALLITSIVSSVAVSGPNFTANAVKIKLSAINPISGLQKLVNLQSFVHLLVSIAKLVFIAIIIWFYIKSKLDEITMLRWAWSEQLMPAIAQLVLGLMIRVCIALLLIGFADMAFQKWKYLEDLKMTKQEVKQEHKDLEGSPEVKARIRKLQYQAALKRFLQEVPKASVVLVNPTHYAVALKYDPKTMDSPVMVAKGADHLAEKIREIARAYGVPIIRRPELTRTIYAAIEPGQNIPPDLFIAVAEVLALIYRIKHSRYQTASK
ncbi:MAG: flagellar biosynthesis protein FlhB [Phycisphaerae bacterium]